MLERLRWLGHGSFLLEGYPTIYINPRRITRSAPPADLILISDDDPLHCSPADIAKVRARHTRVLAPACVAALLAPTDVLRAWESLSIDTAHGLVCVKALPTVFCPRRDSARRPGDGLGYLVSSGWQDVYYAGITRQLPTLASLRPDIAILPVDGDASMTPEEAADAVHQLRPRWAMPCHAAPRVGNRPPMAFLSFQRAVGTAAQVVLPQAVAV